VGNSTRSLRNPWFGCVRFNVPLDTIRSFRRRWGDCGIRNPWTDRHLNLHARLRRGTYPCAKFHHDTITPCRSQICENALCDSARFLVQPTAKTPAPIFTVNTSNDVVSRKDVHLGYLVKKILYFDPISPKMKILDLFSTGIIISAQKGRNSRDAQQCLNVWKSISSTKECRNPHQNNNWPTNGNDIATWMTKPLFKIQSVTNRQTDKQKQTPNFCFSRRRAAADFQQTLHGDRRCPYHFCIHLDFFNPISSFGARALGKMPDRGFYLSHSYSI